MAITATSFWTALWERIVSDYNEAFGSGSRSLGEKVQEAMFPDPLSFFGLEVQPGLYSALLVSAILLFTAALLRIFFIPRMSEEGGKFQILLEGLVGWCDNKAADVSHKQLYTVGPFVFTAAIFIAVSTLGELLGTLPPAFADINTCFGFGISVFIVVNICGFSEKGFVGRIKRYINPMNIISDLSVPLSMSLRLFGAITSGYVISELLYSQIFTAVLAPAIAAIVTTLFHALIQSFIFVTLTSAFSGEAAEA